VGDTDGGSRRYRVLDIKHLFAAKLGAFAVRGETAKNDFDDLIWLLKSCYAFDIAAVSKSTPFDQRKALVAAAERERPKMTTNFIRRLKTLLHVVI
jgi:hypothetical protein